MESEKLMPCDDRTCKCSDSYGICRSDEPCQKSPMTTSEPTTGEIVRALRIAAEKNGARKPICDETIAADRLEKQEQTIAKLTATEILDQLKPELERAREKYKRIKNATTQELASELRDLMRIFDEVFSRIGLERFNDVSTLARVYADRLESQERELEQHKKWHDESIATATNTIVELENQVSALTARAEQAERERDAAKEVSDLIKGWLRNAKREGGSYADALSAISLVVRHWDEGRYLRGLPQDGEGERCRVEF